MAPVRKANKKIVGDIATCVFNMVTLVRYFPQGFNDKL